MPMTRRQIRRIKKRCETATPAPWVVENLKYVVAPCPCCGRICECVQFGASDSPDCYNSEFIAHSRTDIPLLVSDSEQARALILRFLAAIKPADDGMHAMGFRPDTGLSALLAEGAEWEK